MLKRFGIHLLALTLLVCLQNRPAYAQNSYGSSNSVFVNGYVRKDGTYVAPHYRSLPDRKFSDNYSTKGNIDPFTGKEGTRVTQSSRQTRTHEGYILDLNRPSSKQDPYIRDVLGSSRKTYGYTSVLDTPAKKSTSQYGTLYSGYQPYQSTYRSSRTTESRKKW